MEMLKLMFKTNYSLNKGNPILHLLEIYPFDFCKRIINRWLDIQADIMYELLR